MKYYATVIPRIKRVRVEDVKSEINVGTDKKPKMAEISIPAYEVVSDTPEANLIGPLPDSFKPEYNDFYEITEEQFNAGLAGITDLMAKVEKTAPEEYVKRRKAAGEHFEKLMAEKAKKAKAKAKAKTKVKA